MTLAIMMAIDVIVNGEHELMVQVMHVYILGTTSVYFVLASYCFTTNPDGLLHHKLRLEVAMPITVIRKQQVKPLGSCYLDIHGFFFNFHSCDNPPTDFNLTLQHMQQAAELS